MHQPVNLATRSLNCTRQACPLRARINREHDREGLTCKTRSRHTNGILVAATRKVTVRTGSARGCSLVSAAEQQTCRTQRTHVLGSRRLGRWKAAPAGAAVLATRLQLCRGNMQRGRLRPAVWSFESGLLHEALAISCQRLHHHPSRAVKCASLLPTARDPSISPKQAEIIPAGRVSVSYHLLRDAPRHPRPTLCRRLTWPPARSAGWRPWRRRGRRRPAG
jgi:hypothetical protein